MVSYHARNANTSTLSRPYLRPHDRPKTGVYQMTSPGSKPNSERRLDTILLSFGKSKHASCANQSRIATSRIKHCCATMICRNSDSSTTPRPRCSCHTSETRPQLARFRPTQMSTYTTDAPQSLREWHFFVPQNHIHLSGVPSAAVRYEYSLVNVRRTNTVGEITDDIGKWLQKSTPDIEAAVRACSIELVHIPGGDVGSRQILSKDATAEATDLFNRMPDLYIVSIPLPTGGTVNGSNGLGNAINQASQGAANSNTGTSPSSLAVGQQPHRRSRRCKHRH